MLLLENVTEEEKKRLFELTCPHCRVGSKARFRPETGEWVHDGVLGVTYLSVICMATHLRNNLENSHA